MNAKPHDFQSVFRGTDEALIAETMVWPNFFLMNVFFALKGSKLFIIIYSSDAAEFINDLLKKWSNYEVFSKF